jgi:anti-sigma B factor antagonist
MMRNGSPHDPDTGDPTLAIVGDGNGFEARVQRTPDGGDGIVVAVSGEVDMATAEMLWQAVEDACGRAGRVIVDLVETSYLDSSGLAVLIRAYDRLDQRPGAVVVRAPSPGVRQVLTISGLDHVLTVMPEEA